MFRLYIFLGPEAEIHKMLNFYKDKDLSQSRIQIKILFENMYFYVFQDFKVERYVLKQKY